MIKTLASLALAITFANSVKFGRETEPTQPFGELDINHDGELNEEDFETVFNNLENDLYNLDSDAQKHFSKIVNHLRSLHYANVWDRNGDGKVSEFEYTHH